MTEGEERGGDLDLVQETGRRWVPDTGVNVNRFLMIRPVQELEREACTGGVSCQEMEREACTRGVKESPFYFFNRRGGWRWMYRRV
jgi:hypothetical protein